MCIIQHSVYLHSDLDSKLDLSNQRKDITGAADEDLYNK